MKTTTSFFGFLACALVQISLSAQTYSIDRYKVAGGGTSIGGQYSVTGGFWSLYAVQTVGAPLLIITYAVNQAIVSWDPSAIGWTFQTNNNLSTGTWGNYLGQVVNNSATNSPPTGRLFSSG